MAKMKLAILLAAILCLGAFIAVAESPQEAWAGSAHADADSPAFTHWDGADPPLVPTSCARCHSGAGFIDFIGGDGTEAGVVDNPAKPGVITCDTCHNDAVKALNTVTFPSGAVVDVSPEEAPCSECHQGREYGGAVDKAVAGFGPDEVMPDQGFINVHYAASAATHQGSVSGIGYQYAGKTYVGKFPHAPGMDVCAGCHDQHSLQLKLEACVCHGSVTDPATIRMGAPDYDGDGDTSEGVKGEIDTLYDVLYAAIQAYAANAGAPIAYDANSYPYWMNDTNGNGVVDEGEAGRANAYTSFTPRLLKAAYNLHLVTKEAGIYAHNPEYAVQLLIDSIADLGGDVSAYTRP